MATKDNFLLFKDKHKPFDNCHTDTGAQYSDLNLNQNLKVSNIFPIQSKSKSYNDKKIDYTLSERYEEKEKSQTWKKSSATDLRSKYSNSLSLNDENEKCWKKNGSSNATNNSTLSLRISAYENSNEASSDSLNKSFQKSWLIQKQKQITRDPTFVSQSPFEFQRQQNDKTPEPEVSKFKASQRLLNPGNTNNLSLQALLLTMMLEKIDNLSNRINEMQIAFGDIKEACDKLNDRIDAFEEKFEQVLQHRSFERDQRTATSVETDDSKPADTKALFEDKPFSLASPQPAAPSPVKTQAQTIGLKPAETKSLFGNKPLSFAPPSQPAVTQAKESPFDAKPATDETQPKSIFGGTGSSNANKIPLSFSSFASGTSFLDKKNADTPNDLFGARTSSTFANQSATEENENPEEYVPDAHYEPVIPLPDKVDVVTGEESEEVLFKNRCKLYIFNSDIKEIKERGVGDIKVLFNPENKSYRVVMRREQVHKICANFRITKGMNIADKTGTKGCGIFSCIDFSENPQNGTSTVFYVRFREEKVYEEFKKLFDEIVEGIPTTAKPAVVDQEQENVSQHLNNSQTLGSKFVKKEDEWDCQICYVRNQLNDDNCLSCNTSKDGKEETTPAPAFKPTTFSSENTSYSFGLNKSAQKSLLGTPPTTKPAIADAPSSVKTEAQKTGLKPAETKSLFGNKPFSFAPPPQPAVTQAKESPFGAKRATDESYPKSLFGGTGSSNANKTPLSYSSFASGTSFLDKKTADTPNASFGSQNSSTFANQSATEENENPEEYVPDAHYEPVIPLPDKVDVVTGEESEEVLFMSRCKLYIFNSDIKEIKERGVGDIKVLFNPENKNYRVVMRREQVHKICANFRITKSMKISDKAGTKGCGAFNCIDFSENSEEGTPTVFFIRFRDEKVYEEFKKLLTEIADGNLENPTTAEPTSCVTKSKPANVTATSSTTVYDPYFDVDEAEEAEEGEDEYENCDEEIEILLESNCKVTLGEPYKSPFSKKLNDEVYEDVKLVVKVADEDIYELLFVNEEGEQIFPHFIHSGTSYAIDGKKISFVASDLSDTRKSVACEFKNASDAQKVYQTLQECSEYTRFARY